MIPHQTVIISQAQYLNYTYQSSGTYNPSLEVTTNDGCSDIITKPVIVYPTQQIFNTPPNGQYYFDVTGSQTLSPIITIIGHRRTIIYMEDHQIQYQLHGVVG